jgi:hypothetical protein
MSAMAEGKRENSNEVEVGKSTGVSMKRWTIDELSRRVV